MFKKLSVLLLSTVVLGLFSFAGVTHAEGDTLCKGRITGVTIKDNVNAGVTSFNAHSGPGVEDNEATDLSIVGKQSGLAPAAREYAACVNAEAGTYQGEAYKYALKGFAWNTNVGFVSYSCKNGFNLAGGGVGIPCGNIDYGVYINDKNELFGHAWSPSFGWLQFKGSGVSSGVSGPHALKQGVSGNFGGYPVTYMTKFIFAAGVAYIINVDGEVASIYVPFNNQFPQSYTFSNGVEFTLLSSAITFNLKAPGEPFDYGVTMLPADGTLKGHAWTEAGVYMQMLGARIILPDVKDEPLVTGAWCEGKPWICVEVTPNPVTLKFDTKDNDVMIADGTGGYEVHLYLRDENGDPLKIYEENVKEFLAGIKINYKDTVKTDSVSSGAKVADVKSPWTNGTGAVVYKPLGFSDFKAVVVASPVPIAVPLVDPGHYVSKEKIRSYAPTAESNISFTTSTKPAYQFYNDNFLGNVGVNVAEKNELLIKSITYPELKNDAGETLLKPGAVYANGKTDLPLKFRPAVEVNPLYVGLAQDKFVGYRSVPENIKIGAKVIGKLPIDVTNAANVTIKLAYDKTQTCQNPLIDCEFDFQFIDGKKSEFVSTVEKLKAAGLDLQVLALLPKFDDENPLAYATFVKSPTLYTEVSYKVDNKTIAYYSNKIPRVPGDKIVSPSLVVHGSIQGQLTASVGASGAVDTSGQVNVNLIRDTINENIQKNVTTSTSIGGKCTITALEKLDGCKPYAVFKMGNENVIYFKGADVTLKLTEGTWKNEWIVISDGGNIFIDGDIYVPDVKAGAKLSVVSLRAIGAKYFNTGHVYIAPDVQNIQGTIVADGSVFSYDGNHASIDGKNGEPIWATPFDRAEKLGKQLWFQGAIYSDNTIGGADLDKASNDKSVKPKTYLLLGGGETVKPDSIENRVRAQSYDLNYLRMFALDLQIAANGCPIDQHSGKAICAEEAMAIANGEIVCGEKACDATKPYDTNTLKNKSNGINPLKRYASTSGLDAGPDGDLIVPTDLSTLAKGLDKTKDFDPVYVYFVLPSKNSFLFSKEGALNISGN